ncbi:MAG: hypothetical protein J7K22_03060, partial [Nanoarchaeota archaeon]|nr:hypothetical protein [Nanoarchaeota archaeon]
MVSKLFRLNYKASSKLKVILAITMTLLASALLIGIVSAALTAVSLDAPADNANISGTYTFTASVTGTADNATFYWWNSSSSSWVQICQNTTAGSTFTCSYDTTSLPDSTGNIFNVTVKNATVTLSDNNTGITIDNTPPSMNYVSPTPDNDTYVAGTQTINVTANDSLVGLDTISIFIDGNLVKSCTTSPCEYSWDTTTYSDGVHTFNATANDTLDNTNQLATRSVTVDNTPPTTSDDAPSGWQNADFTVTLTCSDATSGCASTSYRIDGGSWQTGTTISITTEGNHTIEYNSTDNAGNVETTKTTYAALDKTAPTTTFLSAP